MKHNRELKKSLRDLVHEIKSQGEKLEEFGKELRKVYKTYEQFRKINSDLKDTADTLVLQYMSKKRKGE